MSSNEIEMQASAWLAQLDTHAPTPQLQQMVAAWRDADPRHEVAFLRMKAAWDRLDRLQALRPAMLQGVDPDLIKATDLPVPSPRAGGRSRWLARAAVMLVAIGAAAGSAALWMRDPVYATGVGGFERVQLNDGSIVELNTDTRLRASFGRTHRTLELLQGEAHFTVSRDITRPFVVIAAGTAVRAVGTAFNVRRRDRNVEVIVTAGRVVVGHTQVITDAGASSSTAVPLVSAGQLASVADGRLQVRELPRNETERELAWKAGMLLFEGDALADVVEEFNRYNRRQLHVADANLASLKIGGYFKATNIDAFVSVLQKDFGIAVLADGDRIVLEEAFAPE